MKNKKLKRIIAGVVMVALVAVLAAMPLIARQEQDANGPQASILSGTVQTGSIDTTLMGGGTLAEEDAVSVSIPSAVKLTAFLVSNGDTVQEGDPIASVDRVTVMTAIAQVQETLDYLAEEIEAESQKDTDSTVTALAGGLVKIIYGQQGQSVQDVMLEHGALAVLSLDGLLAVDLVVESDLAVGAPVTVTFSDGSAAAGKVETYLDKKMTVTLEDDGYALEDSVAVTAEDGTPLGEGELYIYSPWNATAYAGTISKVSITEGKTVKTGDTLMKLTDVGDTAAYRQLVAQRQAYEDLMLDLFKMYQTEQITAPCGGVVSGVDQDSLQLLAAGKETYTLTFLANAPNGNDQITYTNYVAKITAVNGDSWNLLADPTPLAVADYRELSALSVDTTAMTQETAYTPQVPVYQLVNGEWAQVEATAIRVEDVMLFAFDEGGAPVWVVRLTAAEAPAPEETEPPVETVPPTEPTEPIEPTEPAPSEPSTNPTDPTRPTVPVDPSTPTEPGTSTEPTSPSIPGGGLPSTGGNWGNAGGTGGMGNLGGIGSSGSFPQVEQAPVFELYGMEMAQIAAVTPQDTVTLEISIDELDITALKLGMSATVKINALGGEKFTATITQISNTGTNNGGSSKFTVELTMDRQENMLVGMHATASIVLDNIRDILTLPAAALVENGTETLVYTGYDPENHILIHPVSVTTGRSDGETVQILTGLEAGETYYYAYYDTLEISFTPDFGGMSMFG